MTGAGHIRADRVRATESLYGPGRANRPVDTHGAAVVCPFCPGNEHLAAPPVTVDPGPDWTSRVIENLYPAVVAPDGRHEVIVEARAHDLDWTALGAAELARILEVYREREAAGFAAGYAFVVVFKNSGAAAGASLRHPHAQVIALRGVPRSIAARLDRLGPHCDVCAVAAGAGDRTVVAADGVIAYVPDGSRTAFEVRNAPIAHAPRFSESAALVPALARALATVLRRLALTLGESFPFNLSVQSAPRDSRAQRLAHWELEVVPRIENFGGFELGTGSYLVSRLPEDAAGILRAATNVAAHA